MTKLKTSSWRSMLFVPAHVEKFVQKAHMRQADAIILDLEDSVPVGEKNQARELLDSTLKYLADRDVDILVRINTNKTYTDLELALIVALGISTIVVPKVESAAQVERISSQLSQYEQAHGSDTPVNIIAQIESVNALPNLDEIACLPRVCAMTLGAEDFCESAGMEPTEEGLLFPNQQVLFACRRAGISPYGFVGSIAQYSDLDHFRKIVRQASALGFIGAFCIHPDQVKVLNEGFSPPPSLIKWAESVIEAYENSGSAGAIAFEGKMVDLPVVNRARKILIRRDNLNL